MTKTKIAVACFLWLFIAGCTVANDSDGGSVNMGPGSAELTWDAPASNVDGTPLDDLVGYIVLYGSSPGSYTVSKTTDLSTSYSVSGLATDTKYYFAVKAVDFSGNESMVSAEVCRMIGENGSNSSC